MSSTATTMRPRTSSPMNDSTAPPSHRYGTRATPSRRGHDTVAEPSPRAHNAGMTPARRVVAVANMKGGSGKSTTAVNLAAVLAERGERVLVVDLDAQGTAGRWLGVADEGDGLLELYTQGGELSTLAKPARTAGIDVVASSARFIEAALVPHRLAVLALRRAVAELGGPWAWVLIDTPPALGTVSLSGLVAAGEILVTVEASLIALAGLAAVTDAIAEARAAVDPAPRLVGVLVCRADLRQRNAREVVAAVRQVFGELALDTVITDRVALRDAVGLGLPITEYDPHGPAADDYRKLAAELIDRGAP